MAKVQPPLKIYPGYEQGYQQSQDALIRKITDEFNKEKGFTRDDPNYLDPDLLEAWARQESGGDMMQVDVPGDWVKDKKNFGMTKNEKMDPETSLKKALEWAWYESKFTGWANALSNYNGGGVPHYEQDIQARYKSGRESLAPEEVPLPMPRPENA